MAFDDPLAVMSRARQFGMRPAGDEPALFNFSGRPRAEVVGSAGREIVLGKLQELQAGGGGAPHQMMQQLLQSPEFVEAFITDPSIGEFATEVIQKLQAPLPERASPGTMAVDPVTQRPIEGTQVPEAPARQEPTAAEKLTDAIIAAQEAGDQRRVDLLKRHLPRVNEGKETPAGQALKMRAAGVDKTGNTFVDGITADQARQSIEFSRSESAETIAINDLAVRATGNKTGKANVDKLTPEAAEAALRGRAEVMAPEDFMARLFGNFAAQGGEEAVPGLGGPASGQSVFQQFREGTTGGAPQVPEPPGPGETPSPTPTATGNITPERVRRMKAEELRSLGERIEAGTVSVSPEVLRAIVERLDALGL